MAAHDSTDLRVREHFGLRQAPFSIAPDARFLYLSARHREALAHLLYGLAGGGGFVLLTGEVGAGKTTVCQCFLEQVPEHCRVAYIYNPKLSALELLLTVLDEFGLPRPTPGAGAQAPSVKDCVDPLNAFLLREHAAGRNTLLVIDEAQNLAPDVLEQLRLLTNLETRERKLLQIVLIGQPELRTLLAQPALEPLAQRVVARYHLDPLDADETRAYVEHRLAVAGHRGALPFAPRALAALHRLTGGVPRKINLLADRALLGAYAHGRTQVDRRLVEQAAAEVFGAAPRASTGLRLLRPSWAAALTAALLLAVAVWLARLPLLAPSAPVQAAAPERVAPMPAAAATASAPQPSASAAAVPMAQAAAPTRLDDQGLAALLAEAASGARAEAQAEQAAWRALAVLWGEPLAAGGDACAAARARGLQCLRSANASLALLRQWQRPGWLRLTLPTQPAAAASAAGAPQAATHWVLLLGLDDAHARLRLGEREFDAPLVALAGYWRGEFGTLWRSASAEELAAGEGAPPSARLAQRLAAAGAVSAASAAQWIELGRATAGAAPPAALRQALARFQLAQGLVPDGIAGPATWMALNRAAGVAEPRLQSLGLVPSTKEENPPKPL
jgi:general secretion pathway protein A